MSLTTSIDLPGLILPQQHGLWTSAYHLIHPTDSEDGANYDTSGQVENYDIATWAKPNNPLTIERGMHIGMGFHFVGAGVDAELSCYYPCDANNTASALGTGTCTDRKYYPSYITARVSQSAFRQGNVDYWDMAEGAIRGAREEEIHRRLVEGDCVIDDDADPATDDHLNPYFTMAPADSGMNVLNGGVAMSPQRALGLLDEALSDCGSSAGMIHVPTPVATAWACSGCTFNSDVDYGDGMGERSIMRTLARGNIIVNGAGYSGTVGPGGVVSPANQYWVYATSMINLVWDKIQVTPGRDEFGQATRFATNDVELSASQLVGTLFDPGCLHAVLIDLA